MWLSDKGLYILISVENISFKSVACFTLEGEFERFRFTNGSGTLTKMYVSQKTCILSTVK